MKKVLFAAAVGAVIGFSAVTFVTNWPGANAAEGDVYRHLDLFGEVLERVRVDYVEEVDDQELIENALNGMLSSLDPHSSFMNRDSYKAMRVQTKGEFGGLGIEVTMENGHVKVVSPIDDSPASKVDIQSGDLITHLDGEPVLGLTLSEAVKKMRGPIDTEINLTIAREGADELIQVTIIRAVVQIRAVRSRSEEDVAYLRVTQFNEHTTENLQQAISRLKEEIGADLSGYILDLRNNPGGLLDQAVSVSDAFLERGEVVSTRGRRANDGQRFSAKPGDLTDGKPVIALINGGSASASEIVAGALQDHRRAVVLGTKSFGKGSVQTIIPLENGNAGALRLTTSRYYTPSGRSIQAKGITPDIEVEQAKVEPIEQRKGVTEGDLRGHLKNGDAEDSEGEAGASSNSETRADYQLSYALDLIRGLALIEQSRASN